MGVFADPELNALYLAAILGDTVAWNALNDKLTEVDYPMFGLQIEDKVFIESPTVYWLGEIEEVSATYLILKPGAMEIRTLNNLYMFLNKGQFHQDDEVTPLPGRTRIPIFSVIVPHEWVHKSLPKLNRTEAQMMG